MGCSEVVASALGAGQGDAVIRSDVGHGLPMGRLLYVADMRSVGCVRLRIKDVKGFRREIGIRDGRDRVNIWSR